MFDFIKKLFRRQKAEKIGPLRCTVTQHDWYDLVSHCDGVVIPCDVGGPERILAEIGWRKIRMHMDSDGRFVTTWEKRLDKSGE